MAMPAGLGRIRNAVGFGGRKSRESQAPDLAHIEGAVEDRRGHGEQ